MRRIHKLEIKLLCNSTCFCCCQHRTAQCSRYDNIKPDEQGSLKAIYVFLQSTKSLTHKTQPDCLHILVEMYTKILVCPMPVAGGRIDQGVWFCPFRRQNAASENLPAALHGFHGFPKLTSTMDPHLQLLFGISCQGKLQQRHGEKQGRGTPEG